LRKSVWTVEEGRIRPQMSDGHMVGESSIETIMIRVSTIRLSAVGDPVYT
jgi:hypothetical protein